MSKFPFIYSIQFWTKKLFGLHMYLSCRNVKCPVFDYWEISRSPKVIPLFLPRIWRFSRINLPGLLSGRLFFLKRSFRSSSSKDQCYVRLKKTKFPIYLYTVLNKNFCLHYVSLSCRNVKCLWTYITSREVLPLIYSQLFILFFKC
jgi:hypothetical protein